MPTIKLPTGSSPVVNGRSFLNYGMQETPVLTLPASTLRMNVLEVPETPDSVVITQQPSQGRAVARKDGRINLDLTQIREPGGVLEIGYQATKSGSTQSGTLTINPDRGHMLQGFGQGDHYMLEVNENDAIVVEPGRRHRIVHTSPVPWLWQGRLNWI